MVHHRKNITQYFDEHSVGNHILFVSHAFFGSIRVKKKVQNII